MKKFILFTFVLLIADTAFCQINEDYREKGMLGTDRSIYIAGENIHFNAFVTSTPDKLISKIVYVELITPNGKQIKGVKYRITSSGASGKIKIPTNIYSGNYYLRAYTQYMRNSGPSSYAYQGIKIIHPTHEHVLNETNPEGSSPFKLSAAETPPGMSLEIPKDTFGIRSQVKVLLKNNSPEQIDHLTISVVPAGTVSREQIIPSEHQSTSTSFYPETRGLSLSGFLKDENTDQPLVHKKINLTLLRTPKNLFYATYTDNRGAFYFALPDLTGDHDLFISPESIPDTRPKLYINKDFCSQRINLPNPVFELTDKEKKTIYQLAVNIQVHRHFFKDQDRDSSLFHPEPKDTLPFYGFPSHTLNINNYIELPTLEDYLKEISFPLKVRGNKENKHFKIIGSHHELNIYQPLIMVDLVPVYNVNDILEISPEKIDRIEVVNTPYIKGEIKYGGLANIISVNNDLGGVKLPDSGMFVNYSFLSPKDSCEESSDIPENKNIPDARNTLYWNPEGKINSGSSISFSFRTGDTSETYKIKVTGITEKGKVITFTKTFWVK
ncbi:MAG: MG2 domain-containing protein [Bacteroidales bacterium]|jgi:hypothetical protein|nr:MG2 domain-containing protein [Bacteroidales bacterium]